MGSKLSELPSVVYHLDWVGSRGKQEKAKMGQVVVDALSPILPQRSVGGV